MKTHKFLSRILTVAILATAAASPAQVCMPAHDCGDINDDSQVSVADALSVLRRAIGLTVTLSCSCNGGEQCPIGGLTEAGQTTCWDPLDVSFPIDTIDCATSATVQDGKIKAGVTNQFIDNGNGTITDTRSTLTWEKLSDDSDPLHDYDNATYQWSGAYNKILQLNNSAFAGHTDWRLPNIRELTTLLDFSATNVGGAPNTFPIFNSGCASGCTPLACSCTKSASYWTSTTTQPSPQNAWYISFQNGQTTNTTKTVYQYVRAVRGGY